MMLAAPLVALALFACSQQSAPTYDFEKTLQDTFSQTSEPGAALAVFRDGKVIAHRSFGKTPFDTNTKFEIGSVSKQFTATCILMLVDRHKLKLQDRIGDIVPGLPQSWRAATIEQVLHHQSGIPDYEGIAGYGFYDQPHTLAEVLRIAQSKPPAFSPGNNFEYSNTGYYLLSAVVERKSRMAFGKFLERYIFDPLHMYDTITDGTGHLKRKAIGYHVEKDGLHPIPGIAWSSTLGAGGIISTFRDLAKWDKVLYGKSLLTAKSGEFLWTQSHLKKGDTVPYGAGFFIDDFRGFVRQFHTGETNGFTCIYSRFPALHYSVFAFANSYKASSPGALAMLAFPHFAPELSYLHWKVPSDPDPNRTNLHREVLRTVITGQGNLDMLAKGMKDFATVDAYAPLRKELAARLGDGERLSFLRESVRGKSKEYLYRGDSKGAPTFWTLRLIDGKLTSLNWEDE